ncbi:Uncharacterised protein g312 [Pycnogonum litorale]
MKLLLLAVFAFNGIYVLGSHREKRWDGGHEGGGEGTVRGTPGVDYSVYDTIPVTSFSCMDYSPGLYADVETGCAIYHSCDESMRRSSHICGKGTLFNQKILTCDFWWNANCEGAPGLYISSNNPY